MSSKLTSDFFNRSMTGMRAILATFALGVAINALCSAAPIPATVTLGNLEHVYDGTPKVPSVTTDPADLPYQVTYRDPSALSTVVYDDAPEVLADSYPSYGFNAAQLSAMGNYVGLGGTARHLDVCETVLVTWANAADWPGLATENPEGYYHPITITLYEVTASDELVFFATSTQEILIPWRPVDHPTNGYAFRAAIAFPERPVLPEQVMVMVSFNTQSSGFEPIGVPGPYNELNMASAPTTATVGTNIDPDVILQVQNDIWYYPSTGWDGASVPMLRIHAYESAPQVNSVYDDTPAALANSYPSYSFNAAQLSAMGNYVELGGTARHLDVCETVLVTWAKAEDWPDLAAEDPEGYYHPITITLYEVTASNQLVFFATSTQEILIPWRPVGHPTNGYAFRAAVPFPDSPLLPERVLVMVSFNTQSSGFEPIGVPGPYNELNVASAPTTATVGTNIDPDVILQVKNDTWYYPSTGWTGASVPMLRIRALEIDSTTPPVDAGEWIVTARVSNPDYQGSATATLVIEKATATIQLDGLVAVFDGAPKAVTTVTTPSGLNVEVTYDGDPAPPSALGRYEVSAVIVERNYQGDATGELWIGNSYESWIAIWVDDESVDAGESGSGDDPDRDGIANLLEYAFALDPSSPVHDGDNRGLPILEFTGSTMSLVYRRNLTATDLAFEVQTSTTLEQNSWAPATTVDTVLDDDGEVEVIRATFTLPPGDTKRFLRVRVARNN